MKDLLRRVKRKSLRILRNLIYHNYHYRPSGIYSIEKGVGRPLPLEGIHSTEVYPHYRIRVQMPEEFYQAQSEAYIADPPSPTLPNTLEIETDYRVVAIPNGRLYADNTTMAAVILPNNQLLAEVAYQTSKGKGEVDPLQNPIFRLKYYKQPKKLKGVVFNLLSGGGCTDNFAHWLVDVLPMIHLVEKAGYLDRVDWFVLPAQTLHYQRDSMKLLGIPPEKIIVGEEQTHLQADILLATTFPRGMNSQLIPNWVAEFHQERFITPETTQNSPYPKRIYINRRDGNFRKVLNEGEVEKLLAKYGFESFKLSSLPFTEMIRLFANAEAIVSPTGAGMTNLFYCQPGTPVLEICPSGHVHAFYINIAQSAGLRYDYLICQSNQTKRNQTKEEASNENILVDLEQLENKIKDLLPMITRSRRAM